MNMYHNNLQIEKDVVKIISQIRTVIHNYDGFKISSRYTDNPKMMLDYHFYLYSEKNTGITLYHNTSIILSSSLMIENILENVIKILKHLKKYKGYKNAYVSQSGVTSLQVHFI
uniref:Uncharacterized protein n=1 Tax=viral metagenome TaxID=1070528 RepID=A0A6C0CLM9_9ZZZZ